MSTRTIQQRQALRYAAVQSTARQDMRTAEAEFRQPTNHLAHGLRQVPPPPSFLDRVERVAQFVLNTAPLICALAAFAGWLLWARSQGGMP